MAAPKQKSSRWVLFRAGEHQLGFSVAKKVGHYIARVLQAMKSLPPEEPGKSNVAGYRRNVALQKPVTLIAPGKLKHSFGIFSTRPVKATPACVQYKTPMIGRRAF